MRSISKGKGMLMRNYILPFSLLIGLLNGTLISPNSIILRYKHTRLKLREDVYFGNLPISKEYDFVIVGASPSGCVVANRLTENPNVTVLLLEAGAEENIFTDIPALSTYTLFTEYNWKYKSQKRKGACRGMLDNQCTWPSGKGIGGGTLVNGMIYTRGNRRDFDKWEHSGNPGWDYDSLLPYFKKLEDIQIPELINSYYHGRGGPVTISYANFRTKLSEQFLKSGVESGYNLTDYNAAGTHIGFSRIQSTLRDGRRCSASKAYLELAHKRPNLHIAQKSFVTRIVVDPISKTAVGVEFIKKDRKRFVKARKEVILSAGAFNSAQILMLSGVGPLTHLRELEIPVLVDLPVGENLQEHVGTTSLTFTVSKPKVIPNLRRQLKQAPITMLNWEATGQTVLSTPGCESLAYLKSTYAEPGDSPDIELIQIAASYASDAGANLRKNYDIRDDIYNAVYKELEGTQSFSIWVMGMYPFSKGSVKLASKNPFDAPLIYNNFFNQTQDLDVVVQGIKAAIALIETPSMQEIGVKLHKKKLPNCKHLDFGSDNYWQCFVRELTSQYHHQCGTCKMGPAGDPTAVVDPRLRVYGTRRLRIVDASIMPTIPGGHTMSPAYVIGEKGADIIKEDYRFLFH